MIPTPETHPHPPVAKTVVWRHPCDCPTASRPLEPGEEPEHRFDVDGQPFPWYIAENGASFVKHGDYYLVRVAILPIEFGGDRGVLDVTISYWRRRPSIGERAFPWAILDGSLSVEVAEGDFPVLHLTFIAEQVDADIKVPELDIWSARTPHEAELERRSRGARYLERLAEGAADVYVPNDGGERCPRCHREMEPTDSGLWFCTHCNVTLARA